MHIRNTLPASIFFFFFNDTATTEIYTLSLHDALPIYWREERGYHLAVSARSDDPDGSRRGDRADRKSTRLNSSHSQISYAVFCLKKKKNEVDSSLRSMRSRRCKRAATLSALPVCCYPE